MSSRNYETQILDSIQMIVDNAISKADFDKTIKAVINEASNSADGKYIVSYQGSLLVAYSSNLDVHYTKGMEVYVLIPGNDSSQRKTIIGAVDNYGLDYTSLLEGDASYDTIGKNIVNSDKTFELCSYNKEEAKILYHRDNNINAIGYNSEDFETYIKNAEYLICGATFKTALPLEQQLQGDYGIAFDIDYKIDNETITKTYIVNTSKMIGAPYSLATDTRQYEIFNIDTNNILSVKQIYIFAYNFPNIEAGQPNDIFVSKIELLAAAKITEEELNSIALSIITPQGTYFNTQDTDEAIRNMEAQIKIKGRILNNTEDVKYYWFRENSLISNNHRLYNRLSGAGWECLNESNASGVDFMTVEWVPGSSSFSTTKNQNVAKETKYKCIAIYNKDTVLQKDFTITNYDSDYEISILSNQGTQFYHNNGKPTLTCYINGVEDKSDEYLYVWSSIDNNNTFNSLVETTTINDEYNTAKAGYDALIKEIEEEKKLVAATQDQLTEYNNIIEKYEYATRVEKNIVWNIDLRTISFFKTFKCSVFRNSVFIGTASVVITNDLTTNLNYTLVINNGNQVFKYNEAGVAPNSSSLKNPIEILPLSFTLYDKDGKEVDQSTIESNNVFWTLPLIHTLVKKSYWHQNVFEETEEYITYYGYKDFNFDINGQYSISKSNNDIDLKVIYQGQTITAKTNLTFTKTGEVGTNGTDYMCKIVPNVANGTVLNIDPTVILNEATQTYELSYPVAENNIWFKLQLWKNGELVFNDNQSGYSEEGSEVKLEWSMLKNNYGQKNVDKSNFNVNKDTGEFSVDVTKYNNPANIVKCAVKYNGVEYFATMPIITARIKNFDYDISLTKDSGFREVVYSSDGRYPSYDNRKPFEIQVKEKINEKFEDISLLTKDYAVDYEWSTKGEVYYSYWQSVSNLKIKKLYVSKEKRNQKYFEPKESYNGLAVNNAIECLVSRNEETLCSIHIPIYCYLNRYGNAAINGWDGNSISIDKDNSGMILAPQIGAGSKNDDNSFTGIFMGSVKAQGEIKEEHGLFGYNAGQRTIALNAADGSARFGIEGKGQIVLDPATGDAILTSGNYSEEAGTGMEINLSKPSIRFGSGKFGVNSNGQVFADGFATTEYVDGEVKKVNETIEKIEGAAKVLEVQLNTNTITIPCTADYIPLESKTYKINYTVLFCGRDVEDDYSITVREEVTKGLGMNLSTLGEISISTYKTQGVEKDISDFTFDFTYIDGFDTYTIEKKISVVLAPQGKDGKDGEPGKDGQDAEAPVAIKDCEGKEIVVKDGKQAINYIIEGKSEQRTRSGINQLMPFTYGETDYFNFLTDSYTSDTEYWKAVPIEDNWVHVECDLTGITESVTKYVNFFRWRSSVPNIKPSTQYTLVYEFRNVNITTMKWGISLGNTHTDVGDDVFKDGLGISPTTIKNEETKKFLTTTYDTIGDNVALSLRDFHSLANGDKFSYDLRVSVLEGDYTNKEYIYEEFGAAPTPNYSSEIKSVGYENLWNLKPSYANTTSSGTWTLADTAVSIPAGTYTFSCILTGSANFMLNYKYADAADHYTTFDGKITITFTEEVKKVALYLNANSSISNIQLEKGSIAHGYIPYGKIGVEIIQHGKNYLENTAYTETQSGIGYTVNQDKTVIAKGTATAQHVQNLSGLIKNTFGGKYLVGAPAGSSSASYCLIASYYDENNTWKTEQYDTGNGLLIRSDYPIIRIGILFRNGISADNIVFKPMIIDDLADNKYEQYSWVSTVLSINEPLRSVSNGAKDIAKIENGKLIIERNIKSLIFTGAATENWSAFATETEKSIGFYYTDNNILGTFGHPTFTGHGYCSHFPMGITSYTPTDEERFGLIPSSQPPYISFRVFKETASTLDEWKTWLSNNPVEVIVESVAPVVEEYDLPYYIPMFEDNTNIYYTHDNLEPEMSCKYYTPFAGVNGQTIESIEEEFYLSTSKTSQVGGSWTSKAPTWSTGKYMWTRSKIIYTNPYAIAYTTPICDNSWEAVNELQIGGRNILYNSSFSENFDRWGNESNCPIVTKNGFKCAHIQHTEFGKTKVVTQSILGRLEPNTYYTMSGWVLTENIKLGSTNSTCMFYHDGNYNDNGTSKWFGYGSTSIHISDKPGVWNYIKWTFKATEPYCSNATKSVIYIHTRDFTGDVYFRNLKLEKGSVVTDWTPAPEDTITDLAGLQTQIDGKIQSYSQTSDPSSSWTTTELKTQHSGDLWYNPDTKKTQRWSGTAWVNLENAEAQAAAALAGKKAQVFTSQPTPPYYIGDLWVTALNQTGVVKTCKQARASGSYVSTDWVEGLKYTDDSTVNNLKIGGRNLALKTNQGLTYWGWNTADGVTAKEEYIDPDDKVRGVKFTCTTASTSWNYIQYSLPRSQVQLLEPKTEYIISFDIKSNMGVRNTYMQIQYGNATNGLTNQGLYQIKGNETWEHAVYKITTKDSFSGLALDSQLLYFTGINKVGYVIIKNLKLEKGNVATAWTPAPEDTSAEITEQIQGLDTNGRNFILKSQNEQAATLTTAGGQAYIDYDFSNILKTLTEYKTFTISADIKGTAANMTFDFYFRNSSENSFTSPINYWQVGTELKRYSQVITVNSGSTVADIDKLRFRLNSVGTISLFNVKLEVGEKSTIWTPAPEDAIKKMTIYYTISSSKDQIRDENGNLITNINWGTSAQATEKMPYIWQMTQIEYIEGAAQDGAPICITAMERYATKNSLQYLASDHANITAADKTSNKWSYTRPKLSLDTPYMLIRTEIVWSNAPDKPEYINYYCDEDAYTLQKDINNRADTIINDLETGYVKIYKNQIVVSSQEWTKEAMIAQTLPNTFSAIIIGNQGIATYKRQNEDNSLNPWPTWDEKAQRWAGNFNSVWGTDGTIDAQAVNVKNVKAESIISGILTLTNKNADGKIYIKDENGFTTVEATGDGVIISLTGANNSGGRIEITADKGFRAIDKGGMVSFGSSADNSTFEMSQAKVIKYIDFGEYLRGIVFPTDSSSTAHKGLGFIRK